MSPIGLLRIVIGNFQSSSIGTIPFGEIADIYFVSSIGLYANGWGREQRIVWVIFYPITCLSTSFLKTEL